MIFENVELHNVAEVRRANGGMRLQRVPEDVRLQLNEGAQIRVLQPANSEIRFVSNSVDTQVTLSSEGETNVTVFYGPFHGNERYTIGKKPMTVSLRLPERLQRLDRKWWQDQPFFPTVRRLVFGGVSPREVESGLRGDPVIFHAIEGDGVRPPYPEEKPKLRYLAYGTSITHGSFGEGPHLHYVAQTAWDLRADLINLGVAGSCHCEAAFADYIASRGDWDVATLALSVNMHGFPLNEFRNRVDYMIRTIAGADTTRPVACITLYPYFRDFGICEPEEQYGGESDDYRESLREIVSGCGLPNVYLFEGPSLLTNIGGLASDLIHPSDNGMIEIGRNLAGKLKPLLESE